MMSYHKRKGSPSVFFRVYARSLYSWLYKNVYYFFGRLIEISVRAPKLLLKTNVENMESGFFFLQMLVHGNKFHLFRSLTIQRLYVLRRSIIHCVGGTQNVNANTINENVVTTIQPIHLHLS